MGGTIALRTAARHKVAGVVAVNPGLSFYDRRVRVVGLLKYFQRTTTPIQEGELHSAGHRRRRLLPDAARGRPPAAPGCSPRPCGELPAVQAPVLVFKSDTDAVVPPSSLELLSSRLGSRDLTWSVFRAAGTLRPWTVSDAPLVFEVSGRFVLQHAHSTTPPTAPSETL